MGPRVLLAITFALAVLVVIFALARQDVHGTQDLAFRAEQLLARLVKPTGTGSIGEPTWFGLTIRRLAHVVEYALLGVGVSLTALLMRGPSPASAVCSLVLCAVVSLADEMHKRFVPGRHFDAADLALDAAGFVPVVSAVFAIGWLMR